MRLPRWLIVCMLGSIALSFGFVPFAWWWVTWPSRTACTFAESIREQNWDEACSLAAIKLELDQTRMFSNFFANWEEATLQPLPMTGDDVWHARQKFHLTSFHPVWNYEFTVQMGKIVEERLFMNDEE